MALLQYPPQWQWGHQVWVHPQYPSECHCPHGPDMDPRFHVVVYSIYDMYSDDILYIGVTDNVPRRFAQHKAKKPWWDRSENAHLECHDSRDSALVAEFLWIRYHNPVHNKAGKPLAGIEYQRVNPWRLMTPVSF